MGNSHRRRLHSPGSVLLRHNGCGHRLGHSRIHHSPSRDRPRFWGEHRDVCDGYSCRLREAERGAPGSCCPCPLQRPGCGRLDSFHRPIGGGGGIGFTLVAWVDRSGSVSRGNTSPDRQCSHLLQRGEHAPVPASGGLVRKGRGESDTRATAQRAGRGTAPVFGHGAHPNSIPGSGPGPVGGPPYG